MLRGPTSRSLSNLWMCWRAWQVFPRGMRTLRCLLTRVLPRRTKTKSQLARPTGVVARGVAIARETGTAVTVNAAITGGQCASAIVKDAELTIWHGRPKLGNQRSPEPRATRTGRHHFARLPVQLRRSLKSRPPSPCSSQRAVNATRRAISLMALRSRSSERPATQISAPATDD